MAVCRFVLVCMTTVQLSRLCARGVDRSVHLHSKITKHAYVVTGAYATSVQVRWEAFSGVSHYNEDEILCPVPAVQSYLPSSMVGRTIAISHVEASNIITHRVKMVPVAKNFYLSYVKPRTITCMLAISPRLALSQKFGHKSHKTGKRQK